MKIKDIKNKKSIWILWFGREGKSTLRFLQKIWFKDITVLDKSPIEKLDWNIKKITWERYLDFLKDFDLIIKTPWISLYDKKIFPYKEKIISQTQIFFENYKGKTIWITATKGKSTIATLAYKTLQKASYKVKLVWNIGKPVLDEIEPNKDSYDYVIYELSSYMLEDFKPKTFISILWSIYRDHLDWHLNFSNYKKAKLNILKNSKLSLVNISLAEELEKKPLTYFFWNGWKYSFASWKFFIENKQVFDDKEIKLKWEHNMINICSVVWVCDLLWVDKKYLINELKNFKWLKHRLENIWTYNSIIFIDDAISTTPESTIDAIKTFGEEIWTILLWWADRWYDFSDLVNNLERYKIKNIVLFGETGKNISKLLDNSYNKITTKSMKEAIKFAFKNTKKSKICLLSSASPSYGLWKNFEDKARDFRSEVEGHVS